MVGHVGPAARAAEQPVELRLELAVDLGHHRIALGVDPGGDAVSRGLDPLAVLRGLGLDVLDPHQVGVSGLVLENLGRLVLELLLLVLRHRRQQAPGGAGGAVLAHVDEAHLVGAVQLHDAPVPVLLPRRDHGVGLLDVVVQLLLLLGHDALGAVEQLLLLVELDLGQLGLVGRPKVGGTDQHGGGLELQRLERLVEHLGRGAGDGQPAIGVVEVVALQLGQVLAQHADGGVVGEALEAVAARRGQVVAGVHHRPGPAGDDAVGHRDVHGDGVVVLGADAQRLLPRVVEVEVAAGQAPDPVQAHDLQVPARAEVLLVQAKGVVVAHPHGARLHGGQPAGPHQHEEQADQQKVAAQLGQRLGVHRGLTS